MMWLLFLLFFVGCVEGECPGEDLSLAPRPYTKPENLSVCEKPYLGPNCTCPSSMFECACHKFGQCGDKPRCIEMMFVHSGGNECGDWSDEFSDYCPEGRFQCDCFNTTCKGVIGCGKYWVKHCNGNTECIDGSDEVNCTCPAHKFECDCYKTNKCTNGRGCIEIDDTCDGRNDCGDWSDEVNCTCPADTFECPCYKTRNCTTAKGGCIKNKWQCNGWNDCGDWSDEINCTCSADMFECNCYKTSSCSRDDGCINKSWQCNWRNDCGDWSDEANCTCPANSFECDCYKTKNCTTRHGCIYKKYQCDGVNDCGDLSDEVNCTCPAHKFQCACVGTKQCIVTKGSCIDRSLLCDGNGDCFDGSDETHYTCNCSGAHAKCPYDPGNKRYPSKVRCIDLRWIGDGFKDCFDGSDELCSITNFTCQSCTMFVTTCKSKQLARYIVHSPVPSECNTVIQPSCADDINRCENKNVICVSSNCNERKNKYCQKVFICENANIIAGSDFCDRVSSCSDNSDEIMSGFGFKCSGPSRQGVCVLPQVNVYDSVAQCSDKSDLCFVNGKFRCFQCLDKKLIISPKQVCDGIVDCFDMSDECLCLNQSLCKDIRGSCPSNQMHCQNKSVCSDQSGKLCNSSVQCVDQINTKYCSAPNHLKQTQCLPEDTKHLKLDEVFRCAKTDNPPLRYWFRDRIDSGDDFEVLFNSICDGIVDSRWGFGEANCPNRFYCLSKEKISIDISQACDGKIDCDHGSDEFPELCNKTQFYCKSKDRVSIDRKTVCDGIIDCDNESDESKCRCEKVRFYCTNKQPVSIETKLVQNGIRDCSDGSDECVNLAGDAFADVNEMIANPIYRVIFWITAVLALGGNLFVFIATAHSLWNADRNKHVFINTSIFILNLCCSDFLMGSYLLAVMVQATQFSGSYCLFDKEWRSSSLCSGLGALAIISSEASAFTMTAMTTFRLASAFKPFTIRNMGVLRVLLAELFCWILAAALAIIPLLQVNSEYFTTDVWFPNNIFGNDFVSRENISLLAKRITGEEPEGWNDVKHTIRMAFPRNPIKGEFGYYGETSVCMPRLFAITNEFAWEYSTFLITINFLMFIYMVVAYVLFYKQSNRMKEARSNDVSSKMQKRISRLIFTDFCCWIPICIMGYLSVGGIRMPPDAYVLSACLLLPINSALNPLLYSKAIEDQLTRAKKYVSQNVTSIRAITSRPTELTVTYNAGAVQEGDRVIEVVG